MPRRLSDELNELRIHDNLSDSVLVIYYRMPTTEERIGYSNEMVKRARNKLIPRMGNVYQKYGAKILMGIGDGCFEKKVGDKYVPISSNRDYEHFDPEWKNHIKNYASDIIEKLALTVFGDSVDDVDEETEDGEELEKN